MVTPTRNMSYLSLRIVKYIISNMEKTARTTRSTWRRIFLALRVRDGGCRTGTFIGSHSSRARLTSLRLTTDFRRAQHIRLQMQRKGRGLQSAGNREVRNLIARRMQPRHHHPGNRPGALSHPR